MDGLFGVFVCGGIVVAFVVAALILRWSISLQKRR